MGWFKKSEVKDAVEEIVKDTFDAATKAVKEMAQEPEPVEEWIWVEGYKGTDKNMKCRNNFQYELDKQYDMPEGEEVVECQSGFHLCLRLSDVFKYYDFRDGNRFFKVKALVRAEDKDHYDYYLGSRGYMRPGSRKLSAKSIVFTQELTLDELCENFGITDWPEDKKKLAHSIGVKEVSCVMRAENLVELGYSETFAKMLVDDAYYNIAVSVGSQPDLSMDMKVWVIFSSTQNRRR